MVCQLGTKNGKVDRLPKTDNPIQGGEVPSWASSVVDIVSRGVVTIPSPSTPSSS